MEESRGSPEFPTLPYARATVFDPEGFAGTVAVGPSDVAFRLANDVGTHNSLYITGLNPFTLTHCGPSPPCVRFVDVVTFADATLGTRRLARASEAGFCPRLTQPSFARRSNNGPFSLIGI